MLVMVRNTNSSGGPWSPHPPRWSQRVFMLSRSVISASCKSLISSSWGWTCQCNTQHWQASFATALVWWIEIPFSNSTHWKQRPATRWCHDPLKVTVRCHQRGGEGVQKPKNNSKQEVPRAWSGDKKVGVQTNKIKMSHWYVNWETTKLNGETKNKLWGKTHISSF